MFRARSADRFLFGDRMSLESDIKILSGQPIFAELEPEAVRLIAFGSEPLLLGPGDVVFRQGDPSDGGFIVISGALSLASTESSTIAGDRRASCRERVSSPV